MIFLVNDANILIDLLKIGLLDSFFRLAYDFQVTDMVVAEIQEENAADLHPFFANGLLTQQGFTFEELIRIQALEVENPGLSIPDCSCLFSPRSNQRLYLRVMPLYAALRNRRPFLSMASSGVWMKWWPVKLSQLMRQGRN